jgi:monooxygenase
MSEQVDVLIVGAGLSGIGAARHLQSALPARTYVIWEAREAIGGTWDLGRRPELTAASGSGTGRFPPRGPASGAAGR